MTTFLLRAYCPDCMSVLVPVTSAAMPCQEPEAEANCPDCNGTFCVSARVERCYGIARTPVDPDKVRARAAEGIELDVTRLGDRIC